MNIKRSLLCLLSGLAFASCGDRSTPTHLEIDRSEDPEPASAEAESAIPPQPAEDGMVEIEISVPPTFLNVGGGSGDLSTPESAKKAAQSILEQAGISFPPGSSASYDFVTHVLTVRNVPDQIELVEAYTMSIGRGPPELLTCRVEIYEVPNSDARKIQQHAASTSKHHTLRNMARELCKNGSGSFVTSIDIPTMSGSRAGFRSGSQYPVVHYPAPTPTDEKNPSDSEVATPQIEWRNSGFDVEIDPIIGADGVTIDLNLAITQALAPPSTGGRTQPTSLNRFPEAELTTHFTLATDTTRLAGSLSVPAHSSARTGNKAKFTRLVFVQVWFRQR